MKHLFYLFVLLVFSTASFSQDKKFELEIHVDSSFDGLVLVSNSENINKLMDTAKKVSAGIYYLKSSFKRVYSDNTIHLFRKKISNNHIDVFLDTGYQRIKINKLDNEKGIVNVELYNLPFMDAQAHFLKHLLNANRRSGIFRSLILYHYLGKRISNNIDSLMLEYKNYISEISKTKNEFYRKYPSAYIAGYWFNQDKSENDYYYNTDSLFRLLVDNKNEFFKEIDGQMLLSNLSIENDFAIGKSFPNFKFYNNNFNRRNLERLAKEKFVLIHLWATWCKPCVAEMPKLDSIYFDNQSKLEMVSISLDEDLKKWQTYLRVNIPLGLHTIFHEDYLNRDYLKELQKTFIPQYILVDKNLKIVWRKNYGFLETLKGSLNGLEEFLNTH